MANSIALFKKYVDLLDDVYKNAACSSVLDMDGALVQRATMPTRSLSPRSRWTVLQTIPETAVMYRVM